MAMDSYYYGRERKKKNPSFSSTLLDEIYLSIDKGDEEVLFHKDTMKKKNTSCSSKAAEADFLERSCMIEKWMESKAIHEKVSVRRKSAADFETKVSRNALFFNSSSSSSDSSRGSARGFLYSDSEFCDYNGVLPSRSSCYGLPKPNPKPIKTTFSPPQTETFKKQSKESSVTQQGSYLKTKSRASKIYGDLKKVRQQPISPGGKIASFLNTLFTSGNAKKAKISSTGNYDEMGSSKSANASTCSSASSFSRSCLSKTPSSRGKSSNVTKRSVRFYPVSIIVDEDSQPCGHKNVYDDRSSKDPVKISNEELKFHLMEKNRRVEDAARNLLGNYHKKMRDFESTNEISSNKIEILNQIVNTESDDEDDEDAASYASSDLFELDNLSAANGNGMERYLQELPVYETTHLHANRSIANGFIL